MGQPLANCCNPANPNFANEIEVFPLSKENFTLALGNLEPATDFKEIDKDIAETLKMALKFRNTKTTQSSEMNQQLWSLPVKDESGEIVLVYCRGVLRNKEIDGEVTLYFPKGEIFEGTIISKQPVEGAFVFKKGCFYTGEISNNNAEGNGRYENHDSGYTYEGTWSKSLPHGKGKQTFKNGDSYEGEIMYGEKFGLGTYRFQDGKIYQGSFYYNQSDGKGKMRYPDMSHYDGEWKLGKFHGKGVFTWANGEIYEGEFQEGLRHGRGQYSFKNGSYYRGSWLNGLQHGRGVFHEGYDDIEGQWQDGEFFE